jgi:hypothetical protein
MNAEEKMMNDMLNTDELTDVEKMVIEKTERFYRIAFTCKYPNEKEIQEMTEIIEWFKVKEHSNCCDKKYDCLDGMTRKLRSILFKIKMTKKILQMNEIKKRINHKIEIDFSQN